MKRNISAIYENILYAYHSVMKEIVGTNELDYE